MARVYREGRRGALVWSDATRAVHCLSQIARLIETSELEQRLARLEETLAPAGKANGHARNDATLPRY